MAASSVRSLSMRQLGERCWTSYVEASSAPSLSSTPSSLMVSSSHVGFCRRFPSGGSLNETTKRSFATTPRNLAASALTTSTNATNLGQLTRSLVSGLRADHRHSFLLVPSRSFMVERRSPRRRKKSDAEQPLRRVKAYCTADSYNLDELTKALSKKYVTTYLSDATLHIRKEIEAPSPPSATGANESEVLASDIFFFKTGCIVAWGSTPEEEQRFVEFVQRFERNPNRVQVEEMEWIFGNQPGLRHGSLLVLNSEAEDRDRMHEQLAFSWGLVHSVKLSVLEEVAESALGRLKDIPQLLANEGVLTLSHKEIHQRMGDFLVLQGQLNSSTLETPDMYWEEPELEELYKKISRDLEISGRHRRVGERLDYGKQLMEALRTLAHERLSSRLEKVIVALITTEVLLSIRHEIFDFCKAFWTSLGF